MFCKEKRGQEEHKGALIARSIKKTRGQTTVRSYFNFPLLTDKQ